MNNENTMTNLCSQMYEKLKDQKKVTPLLVMKHAQVDFETATKICVDIWRKLREEAMEWAKEVSVR